MGTLIYRLQCRLYSLLERPSGSWHIIYHLGIFAYVLLTLSLSAVMTLEHKEGTVIEKFVFAMEITMAIYFSVEFALRMFCVGVNAKFKGWRGRLRFSCKFIVIIDILILLGTYALLVFGTKHGKFMGSSTVQNLRFLQILRLLHVDRDASSWKMMEKIFNTHKAELIAAYYLSAIGLLVMSTVVYLIEDAHDKSHPEESATFTSYGDSLWWGIITLMAVGYGDIVPKNWVSKLVTVIFALLCVSLFMLVSSVIGVGLTLSVQERDRRKQLSKQLPLAASVIQNYYRQRLMDTKFADILHYRQKMTHNLLEHEIRCAASTVHHKQTDASKHHIRSAIKISHHAIKKTTSGINHFMHHNHKHNIQLDSHASRINTTEHDSMDHHDASVYGDSLHANVGTVSELELPMNGPGDSDYCSSTNSSPGPETSTYNVHDSISSSPSTAKFSEINDVERKTTKSMPLIFDIPVSASRKYQLALIATTRLRFFGAKKRFKIVRKPYDLQDMSDQHFEGELQQMQRLREVQHRLELIVGKPGLSLLTKSNKEYAVSKRLEMVEDRTSDMDKKVDLVVHLATQLSDRLSYYESLDLRNTKNNSINLNDDEHTS